VLAVCQRCPLEALSGDVCVTLHFLLSIVCDSLSCEESASLTSLMSVYKRRSSRRKHTCLPSSAVLTLRALLLGEITYKKRMQTVRKWHLVSGSVVTIAWSGHRMLMKNTASTYGR